MGEKGWTNETKFRPFETALVQHNGHGHGAERRDGAGSEKKAPG